MGDVYYSRVHDDIDNIYMSTPLCLLSSIRTVYELYVGQVVVIATAYRLPYCFL